MKAKTPVIATEYRSRAGAEHLVASNGELNASSKRDLLQQQLKLLAATASGEVVTAARYETEQRNRKLVEAMFNSDRAHSELGEVMAKDLYQTANRRGFARKFLARQDLVQGQFPMVKMRMQDVTVVYATSPSKTESQVVRDKFFSPPEIILEARPFVEQRELNTSAGDVLEEKYTEAMQAIMVGEDRLWYNLANATVGEANDLTIISGTLTPLTLMEVRTQVAAWQLAVPNLLMPDLLPHP
jgi:hypothetical protein